MAKSFVQRTAEGLARVESRTNNASSTPRLQYASLEDTDLPVKDREGKVKATWGKQPDGSFGGLVRESPDQPTLSAPILPTPVDGERVPNNFPVEWDGGVVSGVVPEVHGRTDVWYQMVANESAVDAEGWKLGGSIRDRLGGATTIVVPSTGMVAVAFQMVGADRVTKGPFSAASFVTVTARVDAQDIADRLNEFADGELPDGAYNNLMARLGEFLHVRADQIDVNSLAADTAFIALLETAGIVLSDEAAGRRTEVSGQGLTITDTVSGEVLTQLGTFTDSLFTIMNDDGTPSVTMTQGGGIAAVQVSSQNDPTFGGKSLAGDHFQSARWHVSDNVLDLMPQGASVYWERVFNGETFNSGVSQTGVGVTHLEATLRPNRIYKLKCHHFEMGDRVNYWMQAHITTSGDLDVRPPRPTTTAGSATTGGPRVHGTVPPSTAGNYGTALNYEWVRTYATPQRIRVIFAVGNSSSVGNVHGSLTKHRAVFSIEDVGPSTGPKGYTLSANMNLTTESIPELSDDLSQAYGSINTATYTLNLNTRIATRSYSNGTPRFGHWDNGVFYMTLVEFAGWDSQAGSKKSAQFNVAVNRWLRPGRGSNFQSAVPTFTGLPASFNYDTELIHLDIERNVARYAPRTVNLPSEALDATLPRSNAVIAVGGDGWPATTIGYPGSGELIIGGTNTNARLSTELGGGTEL